MPSQANLPPPAGRLQREVSRSSRSPVQLEDLEAAISPPLDRAGSKAETCHHNGTSESAKPRWRRYLSHAWWLVQDQWFLFALGLLVLIASRVQVPASGQAMKELITTYLCVAIIFLIMGCTLPAKVLLDHCRRWRIHIFVQVQSFLMTSAVVYAVVSLCATSTEFMDPGLMVGLIFMGCVPTTISSNVLMTKQANGNQALTVVQSTLGNFLGPFLTPVLVQIYVVSGAWYTEILPAVGSYSELYRRVFKQLGLSMFLPLAVGQIIQNVSPAATKKAFTEWKLSKLSSFSLLIIIWQTFDQAFESDAFGSVKGSNMVFVVFISIIFYITFVFISVSTSLLWLNKEDTISVAYCVPAKTPAMGVPLSNVLFVGLSTIVSSKIQIPMVIYQGFQIAAGSLLTIIFRKWVCREKGETPLSETQEQPQSFARRYY